MSARWQASGLNGRQWRRLVRLVLDTYGLNCWVRWNADCTGLATSADHIMPRSQGGSDDLANLRPSCRHCNSARADRPLSERPGVPASIDGRQFFGTDAAGYPAPPVRFFLEPNTNRPQPAQPAAGRDLAFWKAD